MQVVEVCGLALMRRADRQLAPNGPPGPEYSRMERNSFTIWGGKGHSMRAAHLHASGGNGPCRAVKVNFSLGRAPQFSATHENIRQNAQGHGRWSVRPDRRQYPETPMAAGSVIAAWCRVWTSARVSVSPAAASCFTMPEMRA